LPGGKSLSFVSPKESNPRKGDPSIPEFPTIQPDERAAKNSPRLAVFNLIFVGGAQTASPLIRPSGRIAGGAARGQKSKPVSRLAAVANPIECFAGPHSTKCAIRPVIAALVLTFFPLQTRRKSSLTGGSAAKLVEPRSPSKYE
jgi:hypothetical protein